MIFQNQSHLEMLTALLNHKVEFLVVGGYAVIAHGYVRTTGDIDIWLNPNNENKFRLLEVFSQLEFDPEGIAAIQKLDFTNVIVFHIGKEPDRIDFLSHIAGVNFSEAQKRQQYIAYMSYQIPYLHIDDLISNKLRSGRLQDLADVEELQKISRISKTEE